MAVPAITPDFLHTLSDDALIALLPWTEEEKYRIRTTAEEEMVFEEESERFIKPEVKAVLDELWTRHLPFVEPTARGKLLRICPRQYPGPEEFAGDVLSLAYLAFLRRTVRKPYENFRGYVYTLIINRGLDKTRLITGRPPRPKKGKEKAPLKPRPIFTSVDDVSQSASKEKTPEHEIATEQLIEIITEILCRHAERNPISARTVTLRGAEGHTWDMVAEEVFPPDLVAGSHDARVGRVRTVFKKNRAELIPEFEKYGITSEHVFNFKEIYRGRAARSASE